jgi:hypothetical protein
MVRLLIWQSRQWSLLPAEGGVMNWKQERDGLIAQTLAFVQSVTGRRDDETASTTNVPLTADTEPAAPAANFFVPNATPDLPSPPPPTARRPIVQTELANEIRARIASFRAHQERFNREREEYFAATLARLRAAVEDPPPPPRPEK